MVDQNQTSRSTDPISAPSAAGADLCFRGWAAARVRDGFGGHLLRRCTRATSSLHHGSASAICCRRFLRVADRLGLPLTFASRSGTPWRSTAARCRDRSQRQRSRLGDQRAARIGLDGGNHQARAMPSGGGPARLRRCEMLMASPRRWEASGSAVTCRASPRKTLRLVVLHFVAFMERRRKGGLRPRCWPTESAADSNEATEPDRQLTAFGRGFELTHYNLQ